MMDNTLEEFVGSQSIISRRELLRFLKDERVLVNGVIVHSLNHNLSFKKDKVIINGELISYKYSYLYYKFYKPKGMLSTMTDPKGRSCIGDLIKKKIRKPLFPVGRLDKLTTGLMILTNDGNFAHKILHPSFKLKKTYLVQLDKRFSKNDMTRLGLGIILSDGPVFVCAVVQKDERSLELVIEEGRNRVVRRIFEFLGYDVISLKRLRINQLSLSGVNAGDYKSLSKKELHYFS